MPLTESSVHSIRINNRNKCINTDNRNSDSTPNNDNQSKTGNTFSDSYSVLLIFLCKKGKGKLDSCSRTEDLYSPHGP